MSQFFVKYLGHFTPVRPGLAYVKYRYIITQPYTLDSTQANRL